MNTRTYTIEDGRAKARELFRQAGVPHRRLEAWKYSDLHAVLSEDDVERSSSARWSVNAPELELVDLSSAPLPDWVSERLGRSHLSNTMKLASFGFARAGFALRARGESVARVTFDTAGQANALIVLEGGAALTLIEKASADGFQNISMEIFAAPGSRLTHVRQTPRGDAVQVASIGVRLEARAIYRAHFANFGGKLSRTEVRVALDGEGAQAHLSGVGVLNGTHADVTTHVTHAVPDTKSTQLFKYVAGGKARGVYQGKVSVAHGADGSDSRQTAKGLLLGDRAEIDLKPELEIFADDVKCAHGAAVGDLDVESLFYLKSRGIPEAEARALLMRAFLGDAVDQIADEAIRASVWQSVETALERLA